MRHMAKRLEASVMLCISASQSISPKGEVYTCVDFAKPAPLRSLLATVALRAHLASTLRLHFCNIEKQNFLTLAIKYVSPCAST